MIRSSTCYNKCQKTEGFHPNQSPTRGDSHAVGATKDGYQGPEPHGPRKVGTRGCGVNVCGGVVGEVCVWSQDSPRFVSYQSCNCSRANQSFDEVDGDGDRVAVRRR